VSRPSPRIPAAAAVGVVLLLAASSAPAYVPNTLDFIGSPVIAHWSPSDFPIPTRVTPGLSTDITGDADRGALDAAMATMGSRRRFDGCGIRATGARDRSERAGRDQRHPILQ